MGKKFVIPDLCPDCQRKKKLEEHSQSGKENKDDLWRKIFEASQRAERCKFHHRHTLNDGTGKKPGIRSCSLTVKAGCGHDVPKYEHGWCWDWREGKFCPDWEEKEEE